MADVIWRKRSDDQIRSICIIKPAAVVFQRVAMRLLHLTDANYGRNLDNGMPTRSSLDTRNVSQAADLWRERITILDAVCLMPSRS